MNVMPKKKSKTIDFNAPATKGDVDELAQLTDKYFRRMDKRFDGIDQRFEGVDKRFDSMVTKKHLDERLDGMEDRVVNRVVTALRADREIERAELEAVHQDELNAVEGKKDAPVKWKSLPRRVTAVEMDVEKIKDHLEIS